MKQVIPLFEDFLFETNRIRKEDSALIKQICDLVSVSGKLPLSDVKEMKAELDGTTARAIYPASWKLFMKALNHRGFIISRIGKTMFVTKKDTLCEQ